MTNRHGDQHRRPHQALPGRPGPDGPDPRGAGRLDLRLPRPQRRGQVDHPQDPRRPHPADRRHGVRDRHPARGRRRVPAAGRLPRPGAAVLRLDDRPRDARASSPRSHRTPTAPAAWIDEVLAQGRPRRRRRPPHRDLLRRDAPAARHRPGADRSAAGPPPRRAGQRPRPDRPARGPRPHARSQSARRRSSTRPTSSTTSSGSATTSRSSTRAAWSGPRRPPSCSRPSTAIACGSASSAPTDDTAIALASAARRPRRPGRRARRRPAHLQRPDPHRGRRAASSAR